MNELVFFFKGLLGLVALSFWTVLGLLCGMYIDLVILRILGIDYTRMEKYPGRSIKLVALLGLYQCMIRDIKKARGD